MTEKNVDIKNLGKEATGEETVRVDRWDGRNRHWIYYFVKQEDGSLKPKTGAVTPFNLAENGFNEEGLEKAVQALEKDGKEVREATTTSQ